MKVESKHALAATVGVGAAVMALGRAAQAWPHPPLDQWATRSLQRQRRPWLDRLMVGVSRFGYHPLNWMTLLGSTLLAGWRWGGLAGAFLPLASGTGGLTNYLLKRAFARTRPDLEWVEVFLPHEDYSFPSGHVMSYTTFFGFGAFLAWQHLAPSLGRTLLLGSTVGLVLLVGPSRIYVGAHWLSDVIAAYLASALLLGFLIEFYLWSERVLDES